MTYISRSKLEQMGEPIGEMSRMGHDGRRHYHGGGKGDSPDPPDYTPVAQSSVESARIMARLGEKQLAEGKRQFDESTAFSKPILEAQTRIAEETARQGGDYYDYMVKNQRPVEEALNKDAMAAGTQAMQDEAAAKAVADSQGGYTRAVNQAVRQGLRYGASAPAMTGDMAVRQAQSTAAAAGGAREREKNLGYAKKLDVAGLYRGLPGASQGAYGVSLNAGNAATANQAAPGAQYQNAMAQGIGTIGAGRSMQQSGLGSILSAQTSIYNNSQNQSDPLASIIGMGLGGWASGGFKFGK